MKNAFNISRRHRGFSLAEVIAALTIGAMVMVAVLAIYDRAQKASASIIRRLDSSRLPSEVLQRIAEDLDGIITAGADTKITIPGAKFDNLYPTARLEILKTFYDEKSKKQTFEEIIWQASYDYDSDADGLVLYRSHSGIAVEDKLLDEARETWERDYTFIPICQGITFFGVQIPQVMTKEKEKEQEKKFIDKWDKEELPGAVTVTISFAEPAKALDGTFEVDDEEKIRRTIALDRTRKIKFHIERKEQDEEKDSGHEERGP